MSPPGATAVYWLEQLNALDEHERVEAKRGSEIGRAVMETVCAFANEPGLQGGTLLLGVTRDEEDFFLPWQIAGVDQPDKLSADLASRCANEFNVPIRVEVRSESVQGKVVLMVTVPEAPPGDKPVYIKSRGLPRGAFRRIGSTDQECTEEDLLVLFQGRQVESFDATLVPDAGLQDIEPDAIADYRQSLAEGNPSAEALRMPDEDLLHAIGALRRDTAQPGQPLRPTVAGIVLFGKPMALRRLLPAMRIEYIRVPGKEWVGDPERRFDSIDIRDPLLRAVRRALAAVLDDLPKSFHLPEGAIERQDVPLLPVNVVREAIVNAVMHRSYRMHGAVQLIRYSNRLEVRNPGYSLKPVEHLGEPGSQVRNTHIAAVLFETRLAETKGTGVGAMRRLMQEAGLESPLFSSDRSVDQFVATYYFQHFLNEEAIAWLARFKDLKLSSEEAKALVAVREQGAIDNAMYRELNRVDPLASSQTLRRLRDAGLLEQRGRGSATYYVPTAHLLASPDEGLTPALEPASAELDDLSTKLPGLSTKPGALSTKLPGLSTKPESLSAKRRDALLSGLPDALRQRLQSLGQRQFPADVQALVVELCRLRPWSAEELASLLDRNARYVRNNYLRQLTGSGRLVMSKPQEPSSPDQTYRAVDAEAGGGA